MSILAIFFVCVAVADLWRAARGPERVASAAAIALGLAVVLVLLTDLHDPADLGLLAVGAVGAAAWFLLSARAITRTTAELPPLLVLGGTVLTLVLCSPWADPVRGPVRDWLQHTELTRLHAVRPSTVLLVIGLGLLQIGTGNLIVRLVLSSIGAIQPHGQPQAADQLKGGRLLGPMERLFIFGLCLAGQLTAAGLVIAAKGLLRFPELTTKREDEETKGLGIDAVTEYFLVGSFVSWLLATASVGLVVLT